MKPLRDTLENVRPRTFNTANAILESVRCVAVFVLNDYTVAVHAAFLRAVNDEQAAVRDGHVHAVGIARDVNGRVNCVAVNCHAEIARRLAVVRELRAARRCAVIMRVIMRVVMAC